MGASTIFSSGLISIWPAFSLKKRCVLPHVNVNESDLGLGGKHGVRGGSEKNVEVRGEENYLLDSGNNYMDLVRSKAAGVHSKTKK